MPEKTPQEALIEAKKVEEAKNAAFRENVGKTFTDGIKAATVTKFYPMLRVKTQQGPGFVVNYGHDAYSHMVIAETFLKTFKEQSESTQTKKGK